MLYSEKPTAHILLAFVAFACLGVWPLAVSGETAATEKGVNAKSLPADLEEILGWLPVDTETVIVSRSFKIPKEWFSASEDEESDISSGIRRLTIGPLLSLGGERMGTHLGGVEVILAVHAARNFELPTGLGGNHYEGCTIARLAESHQGVCKALMDSIKSTANEVTRMGESEVLVLKEKLEEDEWTFFLTSPVPGVLLCATQRQYIETVMERMKTPKNPRALEGDLPEWKYVDLDAPVWALRHFNEAKVKSLPAEVDPIFLERGDDRSDRQVRGIVLNLRNEDKQPSQLHYLSGNPKAKDCVQRWFGPGDVCSLGPNGIVQTDPGTVTVAIPRVTDMDCAMTILWVVMASLGHVVSM